MAVTVSAAVLLATGRVSVVTASEEGDPNKRGATTHIKASTQPAKPTTRTYRGPEISFQCDANCFITPRFVAPDRRDVLYVLSNYEEDYTIEFTVENAGISREDTRAMAIKGRQRHVDWPPGQHGLTIAEVTPLAELTINNETFVAFRGTWNDVPFITVSGLLEKRPVCATLKGVLGNGAVLKQLIASIDLGKRREVRQPPAVGDPAERSMARARFDAEWVRWEATGPRVRIIAPTYQEKLDREEILMPGSPPSRPVFPAVSDDLLAAINDLGNNDVRTLFEEWTSKVPQGIRSGARECVTWVHGGERASMLKLNVLLPLVVQRWGELAPEEARRALFSWRDRVSPWYRGRGDADAERWYVEGYEMIQRPLEHLLRGWARTDPVGAIAASRMVYRMNHDGRKGRTSRILGRKLAMRHPSWAWKALSKHEDSSDCAYLLSGYYQGLPKGWDWAMEARRFDRSWTSPVWDCLDDPANTAESLSGRWMHDDARAANEWLEQINSR